ncbi:MAG: metal/formaldehyde-sensitive transcriptional repressor [Hyphomonadaceae bacterium]|nr:metal/formaldehyde-sensitive transcriptional repressor [Hyphomonadaceae bacterium]
MAHTKTDKTRLAGRIRRIVGQLGAIERALDEEAGCSEVLQQVAAARGAINGLMEELILDHLKHHVAGPDLDAASRAAGVEELVAVIRRYAK